MNLSTASSNSLFSVSKSTSQAIKAGINLIDTAPWYGYTKSEKILGRALKGIPRNAYYINTKVGRCSPVEEEMFDFSASKVTQSVYESLERLGVSYIDVIQVHDPEFSPNLNIILYETLPALHRLKVRRRRRKMDLWPHMYM